MRWIPVYPEKSLPRRPQTPYASLFLQEALQNWSNKICIWWGFRKGPNHAPGMTTDRNHLLCLQRGLIIALLICFPAKPITSYKKNHSLLIKHHMEKYLFFFLYANLNIFFLQKNAHIYQLIHGLCQQFLACEKRHPVLTTTTCKNRSGFLI